MAVTSDNIKRLYCIISMSYLFMWTKIKVEKVNSKLNLDRFIWLDQFIIAQKH